MFDPNSTIPHAHEVRVTMRGVRLTPDGSLVQVSTRSDFIAPDLSGPSTLAIELDKGLTGWTRDDVEVIDARPLHLQRAERARKQLAADDAQALQLGATVIRHTTPTVGKVLNRTGPRRNRRG